MRKFGQVSAFGLIVIAQALPAQAQQGPTLNFYGAPGYLDMPAGFAPEDADFSITYSRFGNVEHTNFSFQLHPRIGATFRYTRLSDWNLGGDTSLFDRSFDLRFLLLKEDPNGWKPAVTLGLQDIRGDGISSGEYIAASRHFGEKLTVTAGLGWGRLGSSSPIGQILGDRPASTGPATGGTVGFDSFFKGDMAPFIAASFKLNDKFTILAEYSSDAYLVEANDSGLIDITSPMNFGLEYRLGKRVRLGLAYMYGSEIGLSGTILLNPNDPPTPGSIAGAPTPVRARDVATAASWTLPGGGNGADPAAVKAALKSALEREGLTLEALEIRGSTARIRIRNYRYDAEAQAIGRAARAMTTVMPPEIGTFVIEPMANGLAASSVTLSRRDIETLENAPDGPERILRQLDLQQAGADPARETWVSGRYPAFSWSIAPYLNVSATDLTQPLSVDVGLRGRTTYEVSPGFVLSGTVTQKLASSSSGTPTPSSSPLPHVRSDGAFYYSVDTPVLETLQAAYFFRPGDNLYARVSAGYLERMFAGVDGELLWKPVDKDYALGVEIAYVQQRDYEGGLGLTDYDTITGHVSGYYEFDNGVNVAVHAGRYLAGDWGATFDVSREFPNGWRFAAYATLTDVDFSDFGYGSFDKGLKLEIPMSWALGKPTRRTNPLTLMSLGGDGGARLSVDGRIYEEIRDYHGQSLTDTGGLFWR